MPLKKIIYPVFLFATVLGLCEMGLRFLGHRPYEPPKISLRFVPKSCFRTDTLWGIGLEPGAYEVTLNEGLTYQAVHTGDGERTCGDTTGKSRLPEWVFTGCSMTYAMGVDDTCAYPYRVQSAVWNRRVRNLSVPGTGGLHQYLRLKKYLEAGHRPEAVFFSYLDFHDSRNVFGSATADLLRIGMASNDRPAGSALWGYAFGRVEGDTLVVGVKNLEKTGGRWPGIRWSSLAHLLQQTLDHRADARLPMEAVSRLSILQARDLCARHGIAFSVVFMNRGPANEAMQRLCAEKGISTVDVSLDFSDPALTNRPYDPHPSALAHRLMADQFLQAMSGHPAFFSPADKSPF